MKKLGKNMNAVKESLEAFGGGCWCTCACRCGSGNGMAGSYVTYYTTNAQTANWGPRR